MLKTALHEAHGALGAKMGPFAGYDMPLYYKEGVLKEHEWVRSSAGIFDVSHMGQLIMEGPGLAAFLEKLTPSSFQNKQFGRAQYTVLTNEEGGIVDDLIITRLDEEKFFIVVNAGCKEKDIAWIKNHMPASITLDYLQDRSLIALQGPKAEAVLNELFGVDTSDMPYMFIMPDVDILGEKVHISRLGYTGEDGFELSVPNDDALEVWNKLSGHQALKPVGLAARDSLRLEMGYCLYGHDIDGATSPVEADLGWVMGKNNTGFIGAKRVLEDKEKGPSRLRVGIRLIDPGVAREGSDIFNEKGEKIGSLTSGGPSPTLKASIGQGYIRSGLVKTGNKVLVEVRGKKLAAEIADMPFIKPRTKSMKKKDAA
ncbi:MAG: glycine cleavage system aminomethyltransferase GcvT [Alphaproteobacteria bacterium]|nr:glycine cleavage system aminomethyltransferase GcvT [Alphaproteobacteria bacterium]MCB1839205.1 glycine cleavage system aminomethyltransferase GcvT [Alphaproteobacteria bacterium]